MKQSWVLHGVFVCWTHLCHVYLMQIALKAVAAHVYAPFFLPLCMQCVQVPNFGEQVGMTQPCVTSIFIDFEAKREYYKSLTSYIMLFCTCLQHPIWMVTSHFDLSVCFLSCVNQQSSTLRNWPCFSWDSKVVIGWNVCVWGWIFKNWPPHQLLCSFPGPCCLSLSTCSL